MDTEQIKIGDLLVDQNDHSIYRVFYIDIDVTITCLLGKGSLFFKSFYNPDLLKDIASGRIVCEHEKHSVVDVLSLTEDEAETYNKNRAICRKIDELYGPTYEALMSYKHKPELNEICNSFNINRETLRRLFTKYIQSGLDDSVLLDKRRKNATTIRRGEYNYTNKRPGRNSQDEFSSGVVIDDKIRKQFDCAIEEYKEGRCKTYESTYSWLVNTYYTETYIENGSLFIRQKSENVIPSKRQFTYYVQKKLSKKDHDIVKTSNREVRNDKRLLLGDEYHDALGPGDLVEIDALEVDVALVSGYDEKQAIGRPILYLMIDVFTRMIIAMSVSLHNNAMIALTNLFLNLADDKKIFCAKYDHSIKDTAWISNIIPRRIRTDRGSDFKSDRFGRICEELGIDRQLVPAATGSLKGSIEQEFRTLHATQKPHLDGRGVITKRYDSNHHEEAVLTVEDYTKMVVDFVVHHNSMSFEDYPMTADMVRNDVHPVPCELWTYGSQKYGSPRPIVNIDSYRYSLMLPIRASLDRTGITSNELSYINLKDQDLLNRMYDLQNKREKIDVRMDPRDITNIYYLKNNMLMQAGLNPLKTGNDGYEGMTLFEYQELLKEKRKLRKEGQTRTQRLKNSLYTAQEAIIQEAMAKHPDGKNNALHNSGIDFEIIEYANARSSALIKHLCCNKEFRVARAGDFLSPGHIKCPFCEGNNKGVRDRSPVPTTKEEFINKLHDLTVDEYELVGEYPNSYDTVEVRHTICGNILKTTGGKFCHGHRCHCNMQEYSTEEFIEMVKTCTDGYYNVAINKDFAYNRYFELTDNTTGERLTLSKNEIIQELNRPTPSDKLNNEHRHNTSSCQIGRRQNLIIEVYNVVTLHMDDNNSFTIKDIAQYCTCTLKQVRGVVRRLIDIGKIERLGRGTYRVLNG